MKVYFHDYDKARKAEKLLWETLQDISHSDNPVTTNGYFGLVREKIEEAMGILREYIDNDGNEIAEDAEDVCGGYVKRLDTFDDQQLWWIRQRFWDIMFETDNANGELDIINTTLRLQGEEEWQDYEEVKRADEPVIVDYGELEHEHRRQIEEDEP